MKRKIHSTAIALGLAAVFVLLMLVSFDNYGGAGSVKAGDTLVVKRDTYDYYADKFGLGEGHKFKTLTYGGLINLLSDNTGNGKDASVPADSAFKQEGDYVILFGGARDSGTLAVAGFINGEAKKRAVTVYVFDTLLDGGISESLTGTIEDAADPANEGRTGYTFAGVDYPYDDLDIADYYYGGEGNTLLSRLNRAFTGKEELTGAGEDRIVTPLLVSVLRNQAKEATQTSPATAKATKIRSKVKSPFAGKPEGYELTESEEASYRSAVATLFHGAANAASTPEYDPFLTLSGQEEKPGYDNTHLAENLYFSAVSYAEAVALLEAPGERFLFLGGISSPYGSAVFEGIHGAAKQSGYTGRIYVLDPVLAAVGGAPSIISGETAPAFGESGSSGTHSLLYANLLDNYFKGYASRWNHALSASKQAVGLSGENLKAVIDGKFYTKFAAASLILYNKAVATDERGGIIDSLETEFGYYYSEDESWTGTCGVIQEDPGYPAYVFLAGALEDIFAKAGLAEAFLQAGYTFESDVYSFSGKATLIAEKEKSKIVLYTYYSAEEARLQKYDFALAGITAAKFSAVSHYYVASLEAVEIIEKVKDKSVYAEGIVLNKPGYDNSATGNGGGGAEVPDEGENPGGHTPGGSGEDC